MNVGSLFSGIGGFDLGLERTGGFKTSWFCEQDPYCTKVLNRHWPDTPVHPDITELRGEDVERVDVLCGGFPCQDLSLAGKGAGLAGSRSGLWSEYARLVGELRPSYVIVENVSALLARGLGTVLGDLATLGYDAEWDCIPAAAVGAPHRRDRVWLVAYPAGIVSERSFAARGRRGQPEEQACHRSTDPRALADADGMARQQASPLDRRPGALHEPGTIERTVGRGGVRVADERRAAHDTLRGRHRSPLEQLRAGRDGTIDAGWWASEPDVGRVAHGVPARVDRLRSLGNALVPQIAEWIGWRIIDYEAQR